MKITLTAKAIATALLAIFVMTACSSRKEAPDPVAVQEQIAEYRIEEIDLVRSTVLDADRAARFIVLLGERDQLLADHVKEIIAYREAISALNADFDAERESFDLLLSKYNKQRKLAQEEIIMLIAAMKNETTVDEWEAISKFQLKRLNLRTGYRQVPGGV